jgi:hypothetical protein
LLARATDVRTDVRTGLSPSGATRCSSLQRRSAPVAALSSLQFVAACEAGLLIPCWHVMPSQLVWRRLHAREGHSGNRTGPPVGKKLESSRGEMWLTVSSRRCCIVRIEAISAPRGHRRRQPGRLHTREVPGSIPGAPLSKASRSSLSDHEYRVLAHTALMENLWNRRAQEQVAKAWSGGAAARSGKPGLSARAQAHSESGADPVSR